MSKLELDSFFATQNRPMAFALLTAGCTPAPQDKGGPATNMYTVGFCRDRNIGKGRTLDEAAQMAVEKGIPGIVTYLFVRDDLLTTCIKAWDEMVEVFQTAELSRSAPVLPDVSAGDIMRVLHMYAMNQKQFAELPWFQTALLSDVRSTTEEGADGSTTTTGGGKVWSLGCSKAIRAKLNL